MGGHIAGDDRCNRAEHKRDRTGHAHHATRLCTGVVDRFLSGFGWRVPAAEIEEAVRVAIIAQGPIGSPDPLERVGRVVVARDQLLISLIRPDDAGDIDDANSEIGIPWSPNNRAPRGTVCSADSGKLLPRIRRIEPRAGRGENGLRD
jgi:hypothetical protein